MMDKSASYKYTVAAEQNVQERQYWSGQLAGELLKSTFPHDFSTDNHKPRQMEGEKFSLSHLAVAQLVKVAKGNDVKLHMILTAGLFVLLHKYSGNNDIIIGSPILKQEIEQDFINTILVFRAQIDDHSSFKQLLLNVRDTIIGANKNQNYPIELFIKQLDIPLVADEFPLFDVSICLDNLFDKTFLQSIPYNMGFSFLRVEESIQGELVYNASLYHNTTIQQIILHFSRLLEVVLHDMELSLSAVDILTPAERQRLLGDFNRTQADFPAEKTLHHLFDGIAANHPDHLALMGETCLWHHPLQRMSMTYQQLRSQSSQLARHLISKGCRPGTIVGIIVEPSIEMMVGLLGILYAGGAYLPIEPNYPGARINFMLADSGASILLTTSIIKENLYLQYQGEILLIDALVPSAEPASHGMSPDFIPASDPQSPAYIIYTSGTTGKPKGIITEHRQVVAYMFTFWAEFELGASDVSIQLTTYTFDLFVEEIFPVLLKGGKIIVPAKSDVLDLDLLFRLVQVQQVTIIDCTPLLLNEFNNRALPGATPNPLSAVHTFISGGDVLKAEYIQNLLPIGHVYNTYGPTETTVCATYYPFPTAKDATSFSSGIPIGKPITNYAAYILDTHHNPVPMGVGGELCIGGLGLARGYLNRPELSQEKFISLAHLSPTCTTTPVRLYKTGDLARWLPDGNIEFLGRLDFQAKIRGYRIELGEIENGLLQFPTVTDALVLVHESDLKEKSLCAYIAGPPELDTAEVRDFLADKLPAYMVPSYLIKLDSMPLTANGKIDRKRLPTPEIQTNHSFVAPKNDLEKSIASIWKEVLNCDNIGINNNYFELGGNSLNIMRVGHQIKALLDMDVAVMDLFRFPTVKTLAAYLEEKYHDATLSKPEQLGTQYPVNPQPQLPEIPHDPSGSFRPDIAVIGMAGRFPGASTVSEFWHNIKHGVECITFVSNTELLNYGADPRMIGDPHYVKTVADLVDVEYFDSPFFGYTPLEAEITDPQIRIFHECVWAALEDAGYEPDAYPGRIGIYAGAESSSFWETFSMFYSAGQSIGQLNLNILNSKDFLSSRIAYKLNLRGPAVSISTACSTSLVAIHFALQGLYNRDCDMALAGGICLMLPGKDGYLYTEGMIMSNDGHCRAFDASANGIVGGNGGAVVVLKTLARAIADGDHIEAIIKGSAINNDGIRKVGFHAPGIDGQTAAILGALQNAGVRPDSIGYIEAHGTGTQLGDTVEMEALKLAFAQTGGLAHPVNKNTCAIGSVKTNCGHMGVAAGMAGFIKTVLTVKHRLIPPSLHFETPNPKIDFENSPFYVNTRLSQWPTTLLPPRAGVSSFGIGGTNAHIILEGYTPNPLPDTAATPDRPCHLLLLSARTPAVLQKITANLAAYVTENPAASLEDVAYTHQVGRKRWAVRKHLVCDTTAQLLEKLSAPESSTVAPFLAQARDEDRKVFFMFPGLGPQYVNMGLGLYHSEPVFRAEMDRCFALLKDMLSFDIKGILYPGGEPSTDASPSLQSIEVAQLAMFIFEYALAKQIMFWGIKPHAMIGYSSGEYVAACLAGVFSLEDILTLLVTRGQLIAQLPEGSMLSVPLPVESLLPLLPAPLSLAINNGSSCVVSGPMADMDAFAQQMKERRLLCSPFESPFAAHSAMLDPILERFQEAVAKITLSAPQIPYISTCTGTWITRQDAQSPAYWVKQFRSTVYFVQGIRQILGESQSLFLEMGPGRDMSALVNREITAKNSLQTITLIRHGSTQKEISDEFYLLDKLGRMWLYGVNIDWQAFYAHLAPHRLSLPTYPFEKRRAWKVMDEYRSGKYSQLGQTQMSSNAYQALPQNEIPMPDAGLEPQEWNTRPYLTTPYEPPRDEVQKSLVAVWQGMFGIKEIGITDDFFELGGDSLKATTLLSSIHKDVGLFVPLKYFFDHPNIEKMAAYAQNQENQTQLPEKRFHAIQPVEKRQYYPLSSAQKRMYFIQQMDLHSIANNNVMANTIQGNLDMGKVEAVFTHLIHRHDILRTSIEEVNGQMVQRVHPTIDFKIEKPLGVNHFVRPFDLSLAPLIRVGVMAVSEQEHVLLVDMHHIISDGTSIALMVQEFLTLYQGHLLPPLPVQYKDYSAWQNREMDGGILAAQQEFWLNTFAGEIPVLDLPYDYPRPTTPTFSGKMLLFAVDAAETLALNRFAIQHGATLYMLLLCVTNIFLSKISTLETIVVGTPIAGRTHADLDRIIGMFVNTLAMKNEPRSTQTPAELLLEVKENALNAFANQDYQYETLVEHLDLDRTTGHNPLFDTLLALQNISAPSIAVPGLTIKPYPYEQGMVKFDLSIQCFEKDNTLSFSLEYGTELFKEETASRLVGYYKNTISAVLARPAGKIADIEIISPQEKEQLLVQFNNTRVEYPDHKTIHRLFEEQVEKNPDGVALVYEGTCLTYRELDQQANRLAGYLVAEKGIGRGEPVGVWMSPALVRPVAIMGILKAGAAFVPLDPAIPLERIKYIIHDARIRVILSQEVHLSHLQSLVTQCPHFSSYLCMADGSLLGNGTQEHHPLSDAKPSQAVVECRATDPAYIIYTSGTTGTPKGILIPHRGIANLNRMYSHDLSMTCWDHIIQFANISFDASVSEMCMALLNGGALYLLTATTIGDPHLFQRYLLQNGITIATLPPPYAQLLDFNAFATLRVLLTAGSPAHLDFIHRCRESGSFHYINAYGPTEYSVCATYWNATRAPKPTIVTIGKPISNTTIYILDAQMALKPIGVAGELCIGGPGLALGYLNNPTLTHEKFVSLSKMSTSSTSSTSSTNIYKTGDWARWLTDGQIEFLGRIDQQVKIRGFRIELGEIETRLFMHPSVLQAVVIDRNDTDDIYLCAYIVPRPGQTLDVAELGVYLDRYLPVYMIPGFLVEVDSIPLTASGKVDRKALPAPQFSQLPDYTPPANEMEEKLLLIWSEVLAVDSDKISMDANFFQLGGHSLKATLLVSTIHRQLQVKIPLAEIFKSPTIRGLSAYIRTSGLAGVQFMAIEPVEWREYYPLSSAQKRLYFLQQLDLSSISYNMPMSLPLGKNIDKVQLELALRQLVARHESLRTSFERVRGNVVQKIHPPDDLEFAIDYVESDSSAVSELISSYVRPFDLSQAPLIRSGLITLPGDFHVWVVDLHHIISDGISQTILTEDFIQLYQTHTPLAPLRIQYKDFASWHNDLFESGSISLQRDYWLQLYAGEIPRLNLVTDYKRPEAFTFAGDHYLFHLEKEEATQLGMLGARSGGTLYMNMLALLNTLFFKYTGQTDIIIGSGVAGRRHVDLQGVVGMFINTLAMRNHPVATIPYDAFLSEVIENSVKGFENQDVQFEELVEKLDLERDPSRNPLVDISLVVQNFRAVQPDLQLDIIDDTVLNVQYQNKTSKFDMTFSIFESPEAVHIDVEYYTAVFKEETIQRLSSHLKHVIQAVIHHPAIPLKDIDLLSEAERQQVLFQFNDTRVPFAGDKTIHRLFEEQVTRTPDGIALGVDGVYMTYSELHQQANRLAHYLSAEKGLSRGEPVGIWMSPSLYRPVAVLGILKAGGAFVPLDPAIPAERIKYIINDARIGIVLSQNRHVQNVLQLKSQCHSLHSWVCTDHMDLNLEAENNPLLDPQPGQSVASLANLETPPFSAVILDMSFLSRWQGEWVGPHILATDPAYIIYTSGTTGTPKGILLEHLGLVNLNRMYSHDLAINHKDRLIQFANISFDASISEMCMALLNGASLFLPSLETIADHNMFHRYMHRYGITIATLPPPYAQLLDFDALATLRVLLTAGSQANLDFIATCREAGQFQYINAYGPTEYSVCATYWNATRSPETTLVTIGKPISNTAIYIVDAQMAPKPIGAAGELCIAGPGLARGYLNNPQLTHEKFVPLSTLSNLSALSTSSTKIYKSGDLARWLSDGNIEFLGRLDQQVKIRGFRIELGEIEIQLTRLPEITQAVVQVLARKTGEKYLCAYFTAQKTMEIPLIHETLALQLPGYMIPAIFMQVEQIPLTTSGKIDNKRLPTPEVRSNQEFVAPKSAQEEMIATIWKEVLELNKLGIDDNFFEVGGNSMDIVKVAQLIKEQLGRDVPLMMLFRYPTVRTLAAFLARESEVDSAPANKEIFEAIDKGKSKLKQRMEKRKLKDR